MLAFIFWVSIVTIIYTYIGYPLLLFLISKFAKRPVDKKPILPTVTILIAAYNEEKVIEQRIRNCLALDYPKDKLEVLVTSDGSTDRTNEIVRQFSKQGVKLINSPTRKGKAHALNLAIAQAKGEIVVFADARQVYDKDAIKELVANFNDRQVGAVSGELHLLDGTKTPIGEGVRTYWEYEKFLRKRESMIHSSIGTTGAIYAIRKELFTTIPENTILDDFIIPMRIVQKGFRVIFDSSAKAYDRAFSKARQEFTRKVRTLAGNLQAFLLIRNMFNPFQCKIALQLISHKLLRLVVPYLLMIVFIINFFLISQPLYKFIFALQLLFYASALVGLFSQNSKYNHKICKLCYTFSLLNLAVVVGCWRFIRNKQSSAWEKAFG